MQGQGSSSNPFPGHGNLYFNDGLGSDQPDHDHGLANYDGPTPTPLRWIGQSSSPLNPQNPISFGQFIGDNFWLSPLGTDHQAITNQDPILQNSSISPSTFNPVLENISMNQLGNNIGHIISSDQHAGPIGPISSVLPGQETGSGQIQRNLDMNAAAVDEGSTGSGQGNGHGHGHGHGHGPYISLDLFRSRTSAAGAGDHHNIPITSSGTTVGASSPVMIYSGSAGYVLEENINREGHPSDGQRRLLCKRRAPAEFASASGQVTTSGESSSSAGNSGGSSSVAAQDNNNNNNVMMINASSYPLIHSGGVVASAHPVAMASNFYQAPLYDNQGGIQIDNNFQRNTRLRRSTALSTQQQNATPVNLWTSNNSNVLQAATGQPQPSVFSPYGRYAITSSAAIQVNPAMQQQPIVQISSINPFLAPQPHQNIWNAANMTQLAGTSFAASHQDQTAANIREALEQQHNRRNNVMINPWGTNNNMQQANPYLASTIANNANVIGNNNIPSAAPSRIQPINSGMYLPPTSTMSMNMYPQPNLVERYAQRVQEMIDSGVRRHQQQQGNYNYCPMHNSVPPAPANMVDVSMRGGNVRSSQVPPLRLGPERQVARPENAAAQRRRRLVSEVRNALGLVRRSRGIRIEDVMLIDPSFLYAIPDVHDNMRLDVDNMSYEELLNLEEQIGDVSTGLSEESILANLRRRKYQPMTIGPPTEAEAEVESCCICQEDYANGEELGKLDCGHDFHFNCIKQWLLQKNSCPICKKTALANVA